MFNFKLVDTLLAFFIDSILFDNETVSLPMRLLNIAEVSEIFNFLLILLDNATVSLPIRLLNIAEVSEILSFVLILFDKVNVSLKL
jgi:hypothetical protein